MQMATGRNSEPEAGSPSFFKVIRYPSAPHLSLPNAFVRRYLEKIPKNPKLVTATGEHSWRLEFVKIGEDYCFAHGWEKLVKDVQLCIRDIVVFWLIDPLTFQVSFLGANGCEKDLQFDKTNFADDDVVKDDGQDGDNVGECLDDDVDDDDDDPDKIISFKKVFSSKTYKYAMSLPMTFVKAAGLQHTESIKLNDHEGKEWTMKILAERYARTKYSLSAGWAKFSRHHKLSDGDVCIFTFNKNEGSLNLTRVLRKKRPIKQETPMDEVDRNRGNRNVKIEDDWSPTEKPCDGGGGGVKVKTEYESGPEEEVVKIKRGRTLSKCFANVKIEDGLDRERGVVALPAEEPSRGGGVEVQSEQGTERVFRSKHVIYF